MPRAEFTGRLAIKYAYEMGIELTEAETAMWDAAQDVSELRTIITQLALEHPELTALLDAINHATTAHTSMTEAHRHIRSVRAAANERQMGNGEAAMAIMGVYPSRRKVKTQAEIETQDLRKVATVKAIRKS